MFGLCLKISNRKAAACGFAGLLLLLGAIHWTVEVDRPAPEEVLHTGSVAPVVPRPVPRPDNFDMVEEAPASPAPAHFVTFASRDIDGGDYATLKGVSRSVCETRCSVDRQCAAYTFNTWEEVCFLKAALSETRLDPRAVSGVRASTKISAAKQPPIVQKTRSRRLEGSVYNTLPAKFGNCAAVCLADDRCVGFNLRTSDKTCSLMDSASGWVRSAGTNFGLKLQPVRTPEKRRRVAPPPDVPPEMAALFNVILREVAR